MDKQVSGKILAKEQILQKHISTSKHAEDAIYGAMEEYAELRVKEALRQRDEASRKYWNSVSYDQPNE